MKKILAAALSLTLLLAGCGSGNDTEASVKLDAAGFTSKVVEVLQETDDMVALSDEKIGDFYDVPFDGLKKATVYVSGTRATSNEVCVLELENSEAEEKAKEVVNKRLEEQKESYKDYIPEEYEKLNGSMTSVKVVGNNVIMVAGIDSSEVENIVSEFISEN